MVDSYEAKSVTILHRHLQRNNDSNDCTPVGCCICFVTPIRVREPFCHAFTSLAQCPTCRQLFHRRCLTKWFATVQSCPTCRSSAGFVNDWDCQEVEDIITDELDQEYECSSTTSGSTNDPTMRNRIITRAQGMSYPDEKRRGHKMALRSHLLQEKSDA